MTTTHAKKSWLDHAASLLKYSLAILVGVIISQSISDWSGQALPVRTGQMLPTSRPAAQVSTTAQVDAWPSSEQTGLVANELKPKVTVAEQIAGLTKLIEADKQRHSDLEAELATLEQRFETASSDFSRLDAQRTQRRQQMPTATLDAESEMAWREARDEFDRIIQRRKAVQQQLDTLQEKLSVEQKMLERLTEATAPTETVDAALASQGPDTKPSSATANSEATSVGAIRSADREKNSSKTQSGDVEKALQQAMGVPVVENADSSEADTKDPVAAQVVASAAVDEQVAESLRKVDEDKRALQLAQGDLELVNHSIDVFGRDLKSSEALLAAADQELKAARQALEHTQKQIATRRQNEATDQTATESELGELLRREQEQTDRVQELHREFTKQTVRVNESKQVLAFCK